MSLELRPLTLGELLDRAFGLYRRHFWLFVGIMALPSLVGLALGVVSTLFNPTLDPDAVAAAEVDPTAMIGAAIWFMVAIFGMAIVYFITYAVALGATTIAVAELYQGRIATIRGAFAQLSGKVGRLTLLLLLIGLRLFGLVFGMGVIIAGAGALSAMGSPIVGGIIMLGALCATLALWLWMVLRYAVSVPVAMIEDQSAANAIRRSIDLTRGSLGRVLVLLIFTVIITYAVILIFQGPFLAATVMAGPENPLGFWLTLLGTVTGSIGGAFTAPLMIVAFAVLYYDLRVRHEALDLQMMLAKLDTPPQPAVVTTT